MKKGATTVFEEIKRAQVAKEAMRRGNGQRRI
jgi:hypothetical protein